MAVADDKLDLGLGQAGVDIVSSPLHTPAGGLLEAANVEFIRELGQGGIGSRGALTPLNSLALNGPVLAMAAIPLPSPVDADFTIPGFALGGNDGLFLSVNGGGTFTFLSLIGLAPTGFFFDPYLPKAISIDATHTVYTGQYNVGLNQTPIITFDGINATTLATITGKVQSMAFMDGFLYAAVVDNGYLVNDAGGTPVPISGRVLKINTSGGAVAQVGEDFGLGGTPDYCTIDADGTNPRGIAFGGYADFTSNNGGALALSKLTFRTGAAPAAVTAVPSIPFGPTFGSLQVKVAGYPPDADGASTYDAWKPTPTCADPLAAQGAGTWQYHGSIRAVSMLPLNTFPWFIPFSYTLSTAPLWENAIRMGLRHPTVGSDDGAYFGTLVFQGAEASRPYNAGTGAPGDHAFVARDSVSLYSEANALAPKTGNRRIKTTLSALNLLSPDANPGVAWFGHFIVYGGSTYVGYGSSVTLGGAAVDGKIYKLDDETVGPWSEELDVIGTYGGNVYPGQPFEFAGSLFWPWFGAPGTVDAGYLLKRTSLGVWSRVATGLQLNGVSFAAPVRA